jgi:putative endonuclease
MAKPGYVYILASGRNGTLYVGVTSDLIARVYQHREELVKGFSKRHDVRRLVHYEVFSDIRDAILREKRLKKWNRPWKVRLIEETNPYWRDWFGELLPGGIPGAVNDTGFPPARE